MLVQQRPGLRIGITEPEAASGNLLVGDDGANGLAAGLEPFHDRPFLCPARGLSSEGQTNKQNNSVFR
jgi:hypothetical protein